MSRSNITIPVTATVFQNKNGLWTWKLKGLSASCGIHTSIAIVPPERYEVPYRSIAVIKVKEYLAVRKHIFKLKGDIK